MLPILALPRFVWYLFILGRDRDPILENQVDVEFTAVLLQRLGESNVDRWRVVRWDRGRFRRDRVFGCWVKKCRVGMNDGNVGFRVDFTNILRDCTM